MYGSLRRYKDRSTAQWYVLNAELCAVLSLANKTFTSTISKYTTVGFVSISCPGERTRNNCKAWYQKLLSANGHMFTLGLCKVGTAGRDTKTTRGAIRLYSSAAYWNHDDQGKGSSSELDMSEYIMFGLDWVCLTTTRPSGHISRRINNVWPMLRQWSFSWSFQDVCLAVLHVRKG